MVIVLMNLQVFGEVQDAGRENAYLHVGRTRVLAVTLQRLNNALLVSACQN